MNRNKKRKYEHDTTTFGICFILGLIGANFIEYGIISIILGFIIGAILARKPID